MVLVVVSVQFSKVHGHLPDHIVYFALNLHFWVLAEVISWEQLWLSSSNFYCYKKSLYNWKNSCNFYGVSSNMCKFIRKWGIWKKRLWMFNFFWSRYSPLLYVLTKDTIWYDFWQFVFWASKLFHISGIWWSLILNGIFLY